MSTVIRAGDVTRIAGRLAPVDLADHLAEARTAVAEARTRAARLLESARREAQRLGPEAQKKGFARGHREGYDKGYAEGKEKGQREGFEEAHANAMAKFDQQHSRLIADVTRVLDEMDARREGIELAARRELLDFAIAIAGKLTHRIGAMNRESVVENLRNAIQLVGSRTDLTIRAHPDDLAAIEEFAESVLYGVGNNRGVHIVPDEKIAPGGCVVNNETTTVDATLETQMDEIVALLVGKASEDPSKESPGGNGDG